MSVLPSLTFWLCGCSGDTGRLGGSWRLSAAQSFNNPLACTHGLEGLEDCLGSHIHLQQVHNDPGRDEMRQMRKGNEYQSWNQALIIDYRCCDATNLNTSWSTLIPAACVNSNSSASSALRIFFFFMAYFWTILVTTSAGDPGAEAARCVGWDIADRIGLWE